MIQTVWNEWRTKPLWNEHQKRSENANREEERECDLGGETATDGRQGGTAIVVKRYDGTRVCWDGKTGLQEDPL